MQTYVHKHYRFLWDMVVELKTEDKHTEFVKALRELFVNCLKIDENLVIEPVVREKGERLTAPEEIPLNLTDLSKNVKIAGGTAAFEMRKAWKQRGADSDDEDALENPKVKFTIGFSSDEDPEDLLERIGPEWGKLGGQKTWPRKLNAFTTATPVVLWMLHNGGHKATIIAELTKVLASTIIRQWQPVDYRACWI